MVTNLLDLSPHRGRRPARRPRTFRARRPGRPDARPGDRRPGRPARRHRPRRAAGGRRPDVLRRGADQRRRQRAQVHAGADASLRISARPMPDGLVRLTVEDAGRACRPTPAAAVRQVLSGARTQPGSRPGTGIGLAVARGLVEAMGGQVSCAAQRAGRPGRRHRPASRRPSRASVADDAARHLPPRGTSVSPAAGGAALLVVEDDDETRAALVRELRLRGYRPIEAADGRRARSSTGKRAGRTWCCSTWACPTWTASTSSGAIRREATTPDRHPVRAATRSARRSRRSSAAPTTT